MRKLFIFMLTASILCLSVFSVNVSASYNSFVELDSDIYLLVNADSNTVVFSKNSDKKTNPAAVVKMATAVVVAENCKNLDALVTASYDAVHSLDGTGCITSQIQEGEQMSVRDLIACMMLNSANDAAVILAEYIGGTVENFVKKMNDTVKSLGCKNTLFTDPTGIDSKQYTTADDLVLIAQKYIEYPVLTDITKELFYTVSKTDKSSERELLNGIDMINYYRDVYYEYVNGIKDGYNSKTGRNVVSTATRDGYTYIAVVMDSPDKDIDSDGYEDAAAFYDCKKMFKWAFNNLSMSTVADTSTFVAELNVKLGTDVDYVRLLPANKVSSLVPYGVDASSVNFVCDIPEFVYAPVKKGDVLGKAKIMYADEEIATVDLVAGEDVKANGFLFFFHLIFETLKSPVFLALAGVVLICVGVCVFVIARKGKAKTDKIKRRYENLDEDYIPLEKKKGKLVKSKKNAEAEVKEKTNKKHIDIETFDGDIDFSLFE